MMHLCREFVPAILDVIAVDESAEKASNKAKELAAAVRDNMQEFLLYGIPKQELEEAMMSMFKRADVDGSGKLDKNVRSTMRSVLHQNTLLTKQASQCNITSHVAWCVQEFKACLHTAELNLNRRDINLLMSRVDINQDGLIEYQEFIPMCFSLMVQRFADHVLRSTVLSTDDELQNYVLHCFQDFDVESVPHNASSIKKRLKLRVH
jgi:Ca2+-binding EF-hand superfamily protein